VADPKIQAAMERTRKRLDEGSRPNNPDENGERKRYRKALIPIDMDDGYLILDALEEAREEVLDLKEELETQWGVV